MKRIARPRERSADHQVGADTTWHTVTVRIPFASEKHASIAKQVIDVDVELQQDAVERTLAVESDELVAVFQTLTVRLARLTVNGFLENVDLVVRTLEEFGEEASKERVAETGTSGD